MFIKIFKMLKKRGFKFVVYKVLTKLCKKVSNKEFVILAEPFDDFYFISTAPHNNPEIKTLRVKDDKDYALELPLNFDLHVKEKKIVAIIHIFYPELCDSISSYLSNISYSFDIYISTDTQKKKQSIEEYFSNLQYALVEVRVFENRGRDIAPMLIGFKDVFEKYDYFIHLHSKKSPHGGKGLLDWRHYLYENLLGSKEIVDSHLYLLEKKNIGISFPQHFAPLRININWGYDFTMAKNLLKKMGIVIDSQKLLEFPSGSMFWARCDAISPLLDLNLKLSDFDAEEGQTDGTLAHAIERSFLYICESQHYRWAKVAQHSLYPLKNTILTASSDESLDKALLKIYRPLFNTYVSSDALLSKNIAEYVAYNTFPSYVGKPRLNLLVPTINSKEVFGGISTALKIFNELKEELLDSYDYRIVVDIGLIDEISKENFSEYTFFNCVEDDSIAMQIVETVNVKELYLRESDIFIATAWWTASSAYHLLDDQKRFFKTDRKLIYLIQDYESDFYAWSAKWVFAENTYKEENRTIAIYNSEELANFMSKKFTCKTSYYLPYSINEHIKNSLKNVVRKKQILFYGRPTVDRNTFDIIVDALSLWQKRNPLTCKEWNIISLGENYQENLVSNIQNIHIVGKASLDEYATYLSESMIGISLMISPHPSYPPLEMAYAGMKVITNSYEGKDLSLRSKNINSLDILNVESVADEIENICTSILDNGFFSEVGSISSLELDMQEYKPLKLIDEISMADYIL